MRKAYVLTHHWVPNFGANLQALATRKALVERGYDVRFLDFRPAALVEKYRSTVPAPQQEAHASFVNGELPQTRRVEDQDSFETLVREEPADLYVTGSDAVFRLDPNSQRADLSFPNPYWLTCVAAPENATPKRVALAPSAMGCRLSGMDATARKGMADALAAMDGLSVRDEWTRNQLQRIAPSLMPEIVPDPVFSLGKLIREKADTRPADRPYVVVSTGNRVDRQWMEEFTRLALEDGYDTVALPTPEGVLDEGATETRDLPIAPLDWMELLARSAGYLGVRFHPVIVTLCAGQPVVALDLYHRGFLDARRSKTWLILNEFELGPVCHGRLGHRFLTPRKAWRQLQQQRGHEQEKRGTAQRLAGQFTQYLDRVLHGQEG